MQCRRREVRSIGQSYENAFKAKLLKLYPASVLCTYNALTQNVLNLLMFSLDQCLISHKTLRQGGLISIMLTSALTPYYDGVPRHSMAPPFVIYDTMPRHSMAPSPVIVGAKTDVTRAGLWRNRPRIQGLHDYAFFGRTLFPQHYFAWCGVMIRLKISLYNAIACFIDRGDKCNSCDGGCLT